MGEKNPFRDKRVFWEKKERKRGMGNDELVMRLRSHKCKKRKKKKETIEISETKNQQKDV